MWSSLNCSHTRMTSAASVTIRTLTIWDLYIMNTSRSTLVAQLVERVPHLQGLYPPSSGPGFDFHLWQFVACHSFSPSFPVQFFSCPTDKGTKSPKNILKMKETLQDGDKSEAFAWVRLVSVSPKRILLLMAPLRSHHFVLIVAACVDKSGTADCHSDLVSCNMCFGKRRMKKTRHLFVQYRLSQKRRIFKLSTERHPPISIDCRW